MAIYEYKTRIRYTDVSEGNRLSDKGILNILSEAASKHSASVGYGLNDIEKTHCTWMVLYWKIKLLKRPHWDTELTIKTWPRKFSKVSSWRDYEIYTEDGEKIGMGASEWVLIDTRKYSVGRITEEMIDDYGIVDKSAFNEEITGKLKEPENSEKVYEYTASKRDIDANHHVYNVNYLELAYNALPEEACRNFENIEIYYKKQIKLGDTVEFFYSKVGDSHILIIKSQDEKTLHAILKFN